jgi:hypothetical protein
MTWYHLFFSQNKHDERLLGSSVFLFSRYHDDDYWIWICKGIHSVHAAKFANLVGFGIDAKLACTLQRR